MDPKYSILWNCHNLDEHLSRITSYLELGIKVLWFGNRSDIEILSSKFEKYIDGRILQCYISTCSQPLEVIDGEVGNKSQFTQYFGRVNGFNIEQYLVEHSRSKNIVVQASAGTGKTAVMIDRIMFLLHYYSDLNPSEVAMITFTNDATNQMNSRLQSELMKRYVLTRNPRYIDLMEKQSQMVISTIDSFALRLLRIFGPYQGFSREVTISSFKHEVDEIITDLLDGLADDTKSVTDQVGLPLYKIRDLSHGFWDKLVSQGYSARQLESMDWGKPSDRSEILQSVLRDVVCSIDKYYSPLKIKYSSTSLSDIVRDLDSVVRPYPSIQKLPFKYLFVDEFQDSDNAQISVVTKIASFFGISIFVVGDIKQSIYRFRGADDTAFNTLFRTMQSYSLNKSSDYYLTKNYRSSPALLDELHVFFDCWGKKGYLSYKVPVVPCRYDLNGQLFLKHLGKYDDLEEIFAVDLNDALQKHIERMASSEVDESNKVVVLCRSNYEISKVSRMCRRNKIPLIVNREGSFFISDAVRDFFSMISSYIFSDPVHKFNYLFSPYSSYEKSIDPEILRSFNGNEDAISEFLDS